MTADENDDNALPDEYHEARSEYQAALDDGDKDGHDEALDTFIEHAMNIDVTELSHTQHLTEETEQADAENTGDPDVSSPRD